jgi:hypothetical protein
VGFPSLAGSKDITPRDRLISPLDLKRGSKSEHWRAGDTGANSVYPAPSDFKILIARGSLISGCLDRASTMPVRGFVHRECEPPSRFRMHPALEVVSLDRRRTSERWIVFKYVDEDARVDDPFHRFFSPARRSFIQSAVRLGARNVLANPSMAFGPATFCPDSTNNRTSHEETFCQCKR